MNCIIEVQELHSWSTWKENPCIFRYIVIINLSFQRWRKLLSGGGGGGGSWIISLRQLAIWASFLKIFTFYWNFWKCNHFPVFGYLHQQNWSAEIFQTIRTSRVRSWQNFSYEITYSQCKIIWKRSSKLIIRPLKKHVTCIMAVFIILTCVLIPPISHFLSPPLCYPLKVTNYGMREKKIFIAASAYHVILKEIEHRIFRHNRIFRHTYMYKKPVWTN